MLFGAAFLPFVFDIIFKNTPFVFEYTAIIMLVGAIFSLNFGAAAKLQVIDPKVALQNTIFTSVIVFAIASITLLVENPIYLLLLRPLIQLIPDFLARIKS